MNVWVRRVQSSDCPLRRELRHLCLTLFTFMRGDGSAGCYPGSRAVAKCMNVHRATVSRWLKELRELGWVHAEPRPLMYGKTGYTYYPAVPMAQQTAPIGLLIGASERANPPNGAAAPARIGARSDGIGARPPENGAPERARNLLLKSHTEIAASPSPADAGSAALNPEQVAFVRDLYSMSYSPDQITELGRQRGLTRQAVDDFIAGLEQPRARRAAG